jgi:polyisoprenoid-binding protein YceI
MKKSLYSLLIALVMIGFAGSASAQASAWTIDAGHSSILFSLRHAVTPFYGQFKNFSGTLNWDANSTEKSSITVSVDPKSVSTGSADRDAHVMSPDFFDADNHGQWTFKSTSIFAGEENFTAQGVLNARGKSMEIPVSFRFLGTFDAGKYGKKAGVTAEFSFLRSALGLGGDLGGMLGDEVKVIVNLEMNGK